MAIPPMWKWAVGETSTASVERSRPTAWQRSTMPGNWRSTSPAPRCETSIQTPPFGVPLPAATSRYPARATTSRVARSMRWGS